MRRLVAVPTMLIAALGCSSSPTTPQGVPPELTALPRALSAGEQNVRDASNAFSMALWQQVVGAQRDANVFISPLSASFALGMTLNGAAGTTYSEMNRALQFNGASQAAINEGYRSLVSLLTSLDSGVQMQVANSIWYRQQFPVRQAFLDTTRKYFDATARGLDFSNQQAALGTINGWVNDATNSRIPTVLDEIKPEHVMFLINAIWFKGSWRERFDPARTSDATFNGVRSAGTVRMMARNDTMLYLEGATFQAVELPYGRGAFVMNVLLPSQGVGIEAFAGSLPSAALKSDSYTKRKVELSLPKFTLQYARTLNDDLEALGMRQAFVQGGADFTGIAAAPTGNQLYIDFVKQKSFVDVNEEGTEAAAATTVGVGITSAPIVPVMRVDRPFVFVLRERLSGTILFMGKVVQLPAS